MNSFWSVIGSGSKQQLMQGKLLPNTFNDAHQKKKGCKQTLEKTKGQ